jgi:hypothetical protein
LAKVDLADGIDYNILMGKLYQNAAWLRKRYHVDKKSPQEIAKECGVTDKTIYTHLDKFNLRKK